jgi:hypothetical protein
MGARDGSQLDGFTQPGECGEFSDIDLVSASRFGIGDVCEPFEFGRYVFELPVLRRC